MGYLKTPYRVLNTTGIWEFSRQTWKNKFEKGYAENRTKINGSLSQRFGINVELNFLADLYYYKKCEKLYMHFWDREGNEWEWQQNLKLSGEQLMKNVLPAPLIDSTEN